VAGYNPGRYGEVVGDYDRLYPGAPKDTEAAVDLIGGLAAIPPSAILEFGIGTGRLALPLVERGFRVAGIDGSEAMLGQLAAKSGSDGIQTVQGDYRNTLVEAAAFSVVVLSLNGIFDPRGVGAQLDIFRNAQRHLVPGGYFVVETWVMHDDERRGDWSIRPRYVGEQHVELQLARYDIDSNTIERTLLHLRPSGAEFVTVTDTYAAPGELDVMAAATGFERIARYGSWTRASFTHSCSASISVFARKG
jgi:SAM-dependent methyltransferase